MASAGQSLTVSSWDSLVASAAWQRLSAPRRVFVTALIASDCKDAHGAVRVAYPNVADESVRVLASQLKNNPKIAAALNVWKPKDTRLELIELTEAHLAKAEPGGVAAQRLLAQLTQLKLKHVPAPEVEPESEPAPVGRPRKFKVGEFCVQDGQKFEITKIDSDGKIVDAREIE
jgi:hypothetical protein